MRRTWEKVIVMMAVSVMCVCVTGVLIPTSAQSADIEYARKEVEKYSQRPKFTPPGPAFNARECMAGKSMISIPIASQIPFIATIGDSMEEVANQVGGFKYIRWRNQGQVSQWVEGVNHGINEKVDLIDLMGAPDPHVLRPQIEAARKAGIQVWASHIFGYTQNYPVYITGRIPILFEQVARLLVDWMIVQTGGKVNALVVVSREVVATTPYLEAMEDEFNTRCPEAKRTYVNVPVVDWASKIQPSCQSEILRNPDLNYIIPIYDSMSQFVVPAITITRAKDRVKIATFNGTPFVVKMIQDGQVEMDIGENLDWIGKANMDTYLRAMCGLDLPSPTPDRPASPIYIFDKNNALDAGTPPKPSQGYGTEYIEGYHKLWGLK